MPAPLDDSAHIVVDRIQQLADQDPQFRLALANVLSGILAHRATPEPPSEVEPEVRPLAKSAVEPPTTEAVPAPSPFSVRARRPKEPPQADLSVIEARCRLKAEGARWAAERQRCLHDGIPFTTAVEPRDRELIERAKELGCFLWMNCPGSPRPADLGLFEVLGSCFEVAADAAALLRECGFEVVDEDLFKECLDVAAEAQSALRSAVMAVEAPPDSEQQALYEWLRTTGAEEQVFIERHLRTDDPADPYTTTEILGRIQTIRAACQAVIARRLQRTRWLRRLQYHAKLVSEKGGTDHDWDIVAKVADEMVRDGMPPSNREIRQAVLPIIDAVPTSIEFPSAFQLILREAHTYRATCNEQFPEQEVAEASEDVIAVREFLKGKTIVIVGGELRDPARQAIKEAFALGEVIWLESHEHQSLTRFKPYILRPEVKLVVLMIRWSSHSFGELRRTCSRHDKLFVRLPGGYNPNQLASQIMAQCGYLLAQEAASNGQGDEEP